MAVNIISAKSTNFSKFYCGDAIVIYGYFVISYVVGQLGILCEVGNR